MRERRFKFSRDIEDNKEIWGYWAKGKKAHEIARKTGWAEPTIYKAFKEFKKLSPEALIDIYEEIPYSIKALWSKYQDESKKKRLEELLRRREETAQRKETVTIIPAIRDRQALAFRNFLEILKDRLSYKFPSIGYPLSLVPSGVEDYIAGVENANPPRWPFYILHSQQAEEFKQKFPLHPIWEKLSQLEDTAKQLCDDVVKLIQDIRKSAEELTSLQLREDYYFKEALAWGFVEGIYQINFRRASGIPLINQSIKRHKIVKHGGERLDDVRRRVAKDYELIIWIIENEETFEPIITINAIWEGINSLTLDSWTLISSKKSSLLNPDAVAEAFLNLLDRWKNPVAKIWERSVELDFLRREVLKLLNSMMA